MHIVLMKNSNTLVHSHGRLKYDACKPRTSSASMESLICPSIDPSVANLLCHCSRWFSNQRFDLCRCTRRHNLFCFRGYDRPQCPVLTSLHAVSRGRLPANYHYCLLHLSMRQRRDRERSFGALASDVHACPLIKSVDQLAQVGYLDLHDDARFSGVVVYRKGPV